MCVSADRWVEKGIITIYRFPSDGSGSEEKEAARNELKYIKELKMRGAKKNKREVQRERRQC